MPRFRNANHRSTSNVCHRIVLPRRIAVAPRTAGPPPDSAPAPDAGSRSASAGRFDEARAEKELVERAVARIRAEAGASRKPAGAHGRQIEILERRLEKLAHLLAQRESELERFKRQDRAEPGIASRFVSVQGIPLDEPMVEAKREFMKRIFDENVALQAAIRSGRSA